MKNPHSLSYGTEKKGVEGAFYVINGSHNEIKLEIDGGVLEEVCERVYARLRQDFFLEAERNDALLARLEKLLTVLEKREE